MISRGPFLPLGFLDSASGKTCANGRTVSVVAFPLAVQSCVTCQVTELQLQPLHYSIKLGLKVMVLISEAENVTSILCGNKLKKKSDSFSHSRAVSGTSPCPRWQKASWRDWAPITGAGKSTAALQQTSDRTSKLRDLFKLSFHNICMFTHLCAIL